ncbi:MAG: putative 4-hydroxybenzoate polyprenyltransferase, partial [Deltaproteobacteria bacterium]|nr:putative 4-hydroxybenzoate polyprenyltransferase [Deltaproteobacteria bacterium]
VLIFAAWKLNPLAFWLSPLAIFLVCFYSFTKRFTSYSHLFLGLAIGAAPVASWIAVRGEISQGSLILGLSVLLWIAGFDILYALQDQGFDQKTELHSIPVRFGVKGSLIIARILHVGTAVAWLWLAREEGLGWIFYVGLALATLLLIWEHLLVKEDDLTKVNLAFMNMNSVIGLTLFFAVVFDVYLLEKV